MRMQLRTAVEQPAAWVWLIGLLVSICAAGAPIDVLRDCAAAAPKAARGIKALEAACPDVPAALRALGVEVLLPPGYRESLSPQGLEDVAELASRYQPRLLPARPNIATLPAIAKAVNGTNPEPVRTWWQRIRNWLKGWLARHDPTSSGAFNRWLDEVAQSATFLRTAGYLCMALIVAAALAVIVNELRAAGFGRRRASSGNAMPGPAPLPVVGADSSTADADGVRQVLRRLVERLSQTGRLGNARSLTHRELMLRSRWDSEAQRQVFAGIAVSAEQLTYGASRVSAAQLQPVVEEGRALLAQLDNSPT